MGVVEATRIKTADAFAAVVTAVDTMRWRPEIGIEELPAPQRLAPYALAIGADVLNDDTEVGNGRLVLLHDPDGNPAWAGSFRCVALARGEIDAEMVVDSLLPEVGWSWLVEALDRRHAVHTAASGTVTAVSSQAFGTMSDDPRRAEVEIRASWTPHLETATDVLVHLEAWQDLLCMVAGLPPLPVGVTALSRGQRR